MQTNIKKHFLTGVAILLPIVLTAIIVAFILNVLTKPFMGTIYSILRYYDLFNKPVLLFSGQQVLTLTSKVLALILLASVTMVLGSFGRLFFVKYLFSLIEKVIQYIPVVNKIYKATKDVVNTVFASDNHAFSQVVLVPFPHDRTSSIGFISRNDLPDGSEAHYQDLVSVFLPATPNPTVGFMLLFKKEQLVKVEMSVEEALKFIISCGVIYPDKQKPTPSMQKLVTT